MQLYYLAMYNVFRFRWLWLGLVCLLAWDAYQFYRPYEGASRVLHVLPGAHWSDVQARLRAEGLSHSVFYPRLYIAWRGWSFKLKQGEYEYKTGETPSACLFRMAHGKVKQYALLIPPGMNWSQLKTRINALPFDQTASLASLSEPSLEGFFMPETYFFSRDYPLVKVLGEARRLSMEQLDEVWRNRDPSLSHVTAYTLMVIASLIEREALVAEDRPKIARVIYNRLALNMLLQIDASMVYVALNEGVTFHASHLRKAHPYNTYYAKGLPPTPIAYPSKASLVAAAHPSEGSWLFYRKNCEGRHVFNDTFEAHKAHGGVCQHMEN